jgi:glycosyltransferase involved in cell wall biosynthesis
VTTTLTVVIPTHNPRRVALDRVLDALRLQTLPKTQWDLLVVDNASKIELNSSLIMDWHPQARIVREEALGLTPARMRGFSEARGEIVVLVDDDNELDPDYLERVVEIADTHPFLGTWSGRITLEFEDPLLTPPHQFHTYLTCREAEKDAWSNDRNHHQSTPWGAGMCVRRQVFVRYLQQLRDQPERTKLDLQGQQLLYGGDTDIAYTGCQIGLGKGVFARLHMNHLIPALRCKEEYLVRCVEGRAYSERIHEFMLSGSVAPLRTDLRGRIGASARRLMMSAVERKIDDARRRGLRMAAVELERIRGKA